MGKAPHTCESCGKCCLVYEVGGCKHLGWKNGKSYCKDYENRPQECKDYPKDGCCENLR
jgi:hypothetical protein